MITAGEKIAGFLVYSPKTRELNTYAAARVSKTCPRIDLVMWSLSSDVCGYCASLLCYALQAY